MSFLREKRARFYFLFLCGIALVLLLFSILMTWQHTRQTQELLLEKEASLASSLLEQGVSAEVIAAAMKSESVNTNGLTFMEQIGHTSATPLPLSPLARQTAISFGIFACVILFLLGFAVLFGSAIYLHRQDALYQTVIRTVNEYSDGIFQNHLPRNENGLLYQMFGGIEELAVALQAKNENEHKSKEFLQEMVSNISHQLKTPLAALSMYTEIIMDEPDQPDTVTSFAEKSMASLQRIEQLIGALLKMARLEAGSIVFEKKPILVTELLGQAQAPFATRAEVEGKQIMLSGPPDEMLTCDFEWTSEAIGNLLKNALDHTGRGGLICVEWKRSPDMLRISVSDNGCGISQDDIHHIFKRFYRSKHSSDHAGVGLGLPLAKAIVEGQGGTISVVSTPCEGTTFTISFFTNLTESQG